MMFCDIVSISQYHVGQMIETLKDIELIDQVTT